MKSAVLLPPHSFWGLNSVVRLSARAFYLLRHLPGLQILKTVFIQFSYILIYVLKKDLRRCLHVDIS